MLINRKDMESRLDRIIAFAELEEFADVPVKNYSSGMYMRLGFALAVDIDPDILMIDEILAVGDQTFQAKSHERLTSLWGAGRTIVLVSHDLESVKSLCTRVCVMEGGRLVFDGTPSDAIDCYLELLADPSH